MMVPCAKPCRPSIDFVSRSTIRESGRGEFVRRSLGTIPLGLEVAFVVGFFVMPLWYDVVSLETIIREHRGRIF